MRKKEWFWSINCKLSTELSVIIVLLFCNFANTTILLFLNLRERGNYWKDDAETGFVFFDYYFMFFCF